jgi:hypothetical protein
MTAHADSTTPSARPRLRRVLPFALFVVFACSDGLQIYDPTQDAEALSTITGVWVGEVDGKIVTLTICEDKARVASEWVPQDGQTCQREHTVGSAPYNRLERAHGGVGCGGCPFSVVAPITATLQHPDIAVDIDLGGSVSLGDGYDSNPYALPYDLGLANGSDGAWGAQRVGGTITNRGRIELESTRIVGFTASLPKVLYLDDTVAPSCPQS